MIFVREIEMADVKKKGNIAAEVTKLLEGKINEMGYMLWDVEYVKEGSQWYLRVTIDQENGIGINDCKKMHLAIDPVLDEADPIEDSYNLEVSSPGVERELKSDEHIMSCAGWDVEAKLYAPVNGAKVVCGILLGLDDEGRIGIKTGEGDEDIVILEKSAVAKLKTVYNFD